MAGHPIIRLATFLPYRLSVTSNAVSIRIAKAYEERFQLSVPEWRLIAILAEEKRLTPLAAARRAEMDKISVSRSAKRLQGRGLIETIANVADGRSHFLELTKAGQDLYGSIAPLALGLERELLADLSEAEITMLAKLLDKLHRAAHRP